MDASDILDRFDHLDDGRWVCREAVTIETAAGPVSVVPGMTFTYGEPLGDVDLAELLERLGAQRGS